MAALSFSPSPPPPAPTTATTTATTPQRNNNSKENSHIQHVNTLGANKPFQKMTVHNVLSESGANALQQHISNQNTIIRKIKDFGMLGAVQSAAATATMPTTTTLARKRPLLETKSLANNSPANNKPTKRTKLSKKNAEKLTLRQQEKLEMINRPTTATAGTGTAATAAVATPLGMPGRKGLPMPQAVARRNARERNRVKQVNNGFAALRERIPEEVSEAFEAQGAGRGASKKLSKVETLRMAVEYIRSLEKLLGFDFPPLGCGNSNSNSSSSGDDSFMFIKDEFDGLDDQFDDSLSNYELDTNQQQQQALNEPQQQQQQQMEQQQQLALPLQSQEDLLLLPTVTVLNGLQYVRIPGTSTYQLLTPDMLGAQEHSSSLEEEHFNALIDTNCLSNSNNNNNNNNSIGVAAAAAAPSNGECVKFASALSRSPVPTTTTTTTSRSSTPATTITATPRSSSSLHQPPNDGAADAAAAAAAAVAVAVAVSPVAVAVANELLLQACAAQQQQQQQLIKQEYSEGDFRLVTSNTNTNNISNSNSPPAINDYQQQQQLLCSPVLPTFYDQEPAASFYDNVVVGLPSFKKEFTDVLQDQSTNTAGGCLSDESMIDAIDWWEAHTPKSDAGTVAGI